MSKLLRQKFYQRTDSLSSKQQSADSRFKKRLSRKKQRPESNLSESEPANQYQLQSSSKLQKMRTLSQNYQQKIEQHLKTIQDLNENIKDLEKQVEKLNQEVQTQKHKYKNASEKKQNSMRKLQQAEENDKEAIKIFKFNIKSLHTQQDLKNQFKSLQERILKDWDRLKNNGDKPRKGQIKQTKSPQKNNQGKKRAKKIVVRVNYPQSDVKDLYSWQSLPSGILTNRQAIEVIESNNTQKIKKFFYQILEEKNNLTNDFNHACKLIDLNKEQIKNIVDAIAENKKRKQKDKVQQKKRSSTSHPIKQQKYQSRQSYQTREDNLIVKENEGLKNKILQMYQIIQKQRQKYQDRIKSLQQHIAENNTIQRKNNQLRDEVKKINRQYTQLQEKYDNQNTNLKEQNFSQTSINNRMEQSANNQNANLSKNSLLPSIKNKQFDSTYVSKKKISDTTFNSGQNL